jgi:hypothetical protein
MPDSHSELVRLLLASFLPASAHAGQKPMIPVRPKPPPESAISQLHGEVMNAKPQMMMAAAITMRTARSQPGRFFTKNAVRTKDMGWLSKKSRNTEFRAAPGVRSAALDAGSK